MPTGFTHWEDQPHIIFVVSFHLTYRKIISYATGTCTFRRLETHWRALCIQTFHKTMCRPTFKRFFKITFCCETNLDLNILRQFSKNFSQFISRSNFEKKTTIITIWLRFFFVFVFYLDYLIKSINLHRYILYLFQNDPSHQKKKIYVLLKRRKRLQYLHM